ncbi:clostripain-related cysteine peptidase [Myxococcota bacterium]|nr:clostripain-related cysteine peptidase [Myxococcota bacterium]
MRPGHALALALTLSAAACSPAPAPSAEDPPPGFDDDATDAGSDGLLLAHGTPRFPAPPDSGEPARWLFLVYMNGDNDLEAYIPHDLNELEEVGSGDGVHVVVQADRIPGYHSGDGDWTGTRRYYVRADGAPQQVGSELVEDLGELDMGDPAVLSDFLLWAMEEYPAERVALVLWNHGDGWGVTSPGSGLISSDDTSGSVISIADGELREALQPFVDAHGSLDLIGFDACNMASWEVGHSLRDQALAMVASEATVGGEGLQYGPALDLLRSDADADGADLAADMARQAVEVGGEWTFSAIDLGGMDALAEAIDAFAGRILDDPSLDAEVLACRDEARGTYGTAWEEFYLDLVDFATVTASASPALSDSALAVAEAARASVLANHAGGPYPFATGLTLFFDDHAGYVAAYADGPGATWAQETRWDEVVTHLFGVL